jgi:hypothetical protein
MWSLEQWGVNSETDLQRVGFFFCPGHDPPTSRRTPGAPEQPTMGEQLAILSTLDDALAYFRRVERERNEALTRL